MNNNIEKKELPDEISNIIQAWMYDMQSENKSGTYFLDSKYLGTITIHINNNWP